MNKSTPLYFDYAATTPVDKRVLDAMLPYFSTYFGNASSNGHTWGWQAAEAVQIAREQVAALINCEPNEIIFTSGATESINLAIKGLAATFPDKKHILTVKTEHKATLETCAYLERMGIEVSYLSVNNNGLISLDELEKSIRSDTLLIAVMWVNNETGVLQPVEEIGKIAKEKGVYFLSDAVQAAGKIEIDVQKVGVDLLPLSAHKFYGAKGAGALYMRRRNPRVRLLPIIEGGGQERGLRGGTLNVPAIVAMGKAAEIAKRELLEDYKRTLSYQKQLESALLAHQNIKINGANAPRSPYISNLLWLGNSGESLQKKFPEIAFSLGSACSSALKSPSHVLTAMGFSEQEAFSSIRISLGKMTSGEELAYLCERMRLG